MSPKQIRSIHWCVGRISSAHKELMNTLENVTLSAADFRVFKGQKQARECLASVTRANDIRLLKESQIICAGTFRSFFFETGGA